MENQEAFPGAYQASLAEGGSRKEACLVEDQVEDQAFRVLVVPAYRVACQIEEA